jgi:hypothetical protein
MKLRMLPKSWMYCCFSFGQLGCPGWPHARGNVALLGVGGDDQQGHTEPVDVVTGTTVQAAGVAATDARVVAAPGQDVVVPAAPVVPDNQDNRVGPVSAIGRELVLLLS